MAAGTPDYYRTIRQSFGGAKTVTSFKAVTANDETILTVITGKGIIYGGYIWVDHTVSQKDSKLIIVVDGEKISMETFANLNAHHIDRDHAYTVYMRKYDEENYIYVAAVSSGITFEENFAIDYYEAHGETPVLHWRVFYTLL